MRELILCLVTLSGLATAMIKSNTEDDMIQQQFDFFMRYESLLNFTYF